jgi:Putative adhesin Stv domain
MPVPAFYRGGIVNNNMNWGEAYKNIEDYLAGSLDIEFFKLDYIDILETMSDSGEDSRKLAKKHSKLGTIDTQKKHRKSGILVNKQKFLSLDRYLKTALLGRSGTYSKLSDEQIKVLAYCLIHDTTRLRTIRSKEDFLTLAMKWFYPSPTNKPRISKGISDRIQLFEKRNQRRICLIGHGVFISQTPRITVPQGKRIHFYTGVDQVLLNDVGKLIEGFSSGAGIVPPLETYGHGEKIEDYYLGFPEGLVVNTCGMNTKFDMVIIPDKGKFLPLSSLLKGICQQVTDIHWLACRNELYRYQLENSDKWKVVKSRHDSNRIAYLTDKKARSTNLIKFDPCDPSKTTTTPTDSLH